MSLICPVRITGNKGQHSFTINSHFVVVAAKEKWVIVASKTNSHNGNILEAREPKSDLTASVW